MNTATAQQETLQQTIAQPANQPIKKACLSCSNGSCAKTSKTSKTSLPSNTMATVSPSATLEAIGTKPSTPLQPSPANPLATPTKALQQQKTAWQRFAAKFAEAHPIGRKPAYLQAHAGPPVSHYIRRLGRTGMLFFPVIIGFFSWPFVFKAVIQASNQVKGTGKVGKGSKMERKRGIDNEAWEMNVAD